MAETADKEKTDGKIGVFLCKCGKNIAGSVNVDAIAKEIEKIPEVKLVQVNTYTCSDPGQVEIENAVKEQGIERILSRYGNNATIAVIPKGPYILTNVKM